jgi:glycosyltransferase involved in cell wall biosynthesis
MSAERTRLCIVSPNHSSERAGGAEYQIDCLVDVLRRRDQYDIFYLARAVDPKFQPSGYQIVRIGRSSRMPRFGYSTDIVPLFRALDRIKPQVIYQRVACGYSGIAALYARHRHARLIWHIAHDSDIALENPDPGRNPLRRIVERRSIAYCIRNADHIIAQTAHQAQLLEKLHGRRADAVIPNWHPDPEDTLDKSGPATVLWVANFKPWKRPEIFVEVARALADLPDIRFLMVGAAATGSGDRDWNDELMRTIQATPNLQYLGAQSQLEVNRLMARAHVFVNTSVAEGFPNTYVQAWQRETPVVALDVDPDDVLERNGVGIHAGSPARLAEAVRQFATNPARRAEYGARARMYAQRNHSILNVDMVAALFATPAQTFRTCS